MKTLKGMSALLLVGLMLGGCADSSDSMAAQKEAMTMAQTQALQESGNDAIAEAAPLSQAEILAAVLLVVSRELMRDFNEYSMLMLGGLMVLMMIWRPQGLLPMTRPQLKLKNGAAKGEQA